MFEPGRWGAGSARRRPKAPLNVLFIAQAVAGQLLIAVAFWVFNGFMRASGVLVGLLVLALAVLGWAGSHKPHKPNVLAAAIILSVLVLPSLSHMSAHAARSSRVACALSQIALMETASTASTASLTTSRERVFGSVQLRLVRTLRGIILRVPLNLLG